jgi:microcystin-dependent protein
MSDPFVAEIRLFASNFAPTGWAFCHGQLLPISQNTALFSLLGTFYGGDGKSTFALPDLQGRAAMHQGQGQGLSQRFLGEEGGSETVALLQSEIPNHSHTLRGTDTPASYNVPTGGRVLAASLGGQAYAAPVGGGTAPSPAQASFGMLGVVGGDLPHNNMQPYLTLNYCIALQGIFPARW